MVGSWQMENGQNCKAAKSYQPKKHIFFACVIEVFVWNNTNLVDRRFFYVKELSLLISLTSLFLHHEFDFPMPIGAPTLYNMLL